MNLEAVKELFAVHLCKEHYLHATAEGVKVSKGTVEDILATHAYEFESVDNTYFGEITILSDRLYRGIMVYVLQIDPETRLTYW